MIIRFKIDKRVIFRLNIEKDSVKNRNVFTLSFRFVASVKLYSNLVFKLLSYLEVALECSFLLLFSNIDGAGDGVCRDVQCRTFDPNVLLGTESNDQRTGVIGGGFFDLREQNGFCFT